MATCTAAIRSTSDYALAYARSAPGTSSAILGVVPVNVGGYRVLAVQSDGTHQWLKLEFDGGASGWVRDDLVDIQGDCSLLGYGILTAPTQASTLVLSAPPKSPQPISDDKTPITRPPVVDPDAFTAACRASADAAY